MRAERIYHRMPYNVEKKIKNDKLITWPLGDVVFSYLVIFPATFFPFCQSGSQMPALMWSCRHPFLIIQVAPAGPFIAAVYRHTRLVWCSIEQTCYWIDLHWAELNWIELKWIITGNTCQSFLYSIFFLMQIESQEKEDIASPVKKKNIKSGIFV